MHRFNKPHPDGSTAPTDRRGPRRRPRLRPPASMAVALMALFVALGGTSYAAITISGKNVKNGSLTGADIKNGSLRGTDVRNRSLTSSDLSSGTISSLRGTSGPAGPAGTSGPAGPAGPAGTFGTVTVRSAVYSSGAPVTASCQSGEVAVGGGVSTGSPFGFPRVSAPTPTSGTPTGWQGQVVNTSNVAVSGTVYAVCARR